MFILFLLFFPYLFKIFIIGNAFYIDDHLSYISITISDMLIISIIYMLFSTANKLKPYLFITLRTISLVLYLLYIIDIALILSFSTRLYILDIFNIIDSIHLILPEATLTSLLTLILIMLLVVIFLQKRDKDNYGYVFATINIVLISLSCIFYPTTTSVRSVFFKNYLDVNINSTNLKSYSNSFTSDFSYQPKEKCELVKTTPPDSIYIFLLESWSYYHSNHFGKINNWTPNLDKLAKNNISLNQFYANGFTTEAGLYSILTGRLPILYTQNMKLDGSVGLMNFNVTNSLPKKTYELGYTPYFITSGDLDFLDKGKWLKNIGFKFLIGDSDYPKNSKRYLFNSVADHELYKKVEQISSSSNNRKLIVVENVSTHAPFYFPGENGETIQSEEKAFIYSDKVLTELLSTINKERNLIIVLSDHRAMTTITKDENNLSGMLAVSRVPAFIIWNEENVDLNMKFQQTDIMNSILSLIQNKRCTGDMTGSLFPLHKAQSPKCIIHARGDNRNIVTAKCENNTDGFNILLDGDNTRSLDTESDAKLAIDLINHTRINQM